MGPIEEALESRNEGLHRLREIDNAMREIYPATNAVRYSELADERSGVVLALAHMGAEAWAFDPERDNSWLAN